MPFLLHPEATKSFNKKAEGLFQRVVLDPHDKAATHVGFEPDVMSHSIPAEDIHSFSSDHYVAGPLNREIAKTFVINGTTFGLFGEDYKDLVRLAETLQQTKTLNKVVTIQFLVDSIFTWIATGHKGGSAVPMAEAVLADVEEAVQEVELWLPIAMLYIETAFVIGRIKLKTITKEMIDDYHQATIDQIRKDGHQIGPELEQHFRVERQELQGLAAATITVQAEPRRAMEIAFEEGENSLALLRLYSLANLEPEMPSYCTFLGKEHIDQARTYTIQNGKVRGFSRALITAADTTWKLDKATIDDVVLKQGLGMLSNLLVKDTRTEYEEALLDCLFLYSRCALAKEPGNKLMAMLTALESMLLQNSSEPIQQNLAERIAYLFDPGKRIEVKRSVLMAYGLRSRFIHHGHRISADEMDDLREFFINVWAALHGLIGLTQVCQTKAEFFKKFEEAKMSGGKMFASN
jgi:hypothetical protein